MTTRRPQLPGLLRCALCERPLMRLLHGMRVGPKCAVKAGLLTPRPRGVAHIKPPPPAEKPEGQGDLFEMMEAAEAATE